ncbi:MAG: hypothetical protein HYV27_13860 [Candidatus Hydrogenedentes bacterium]|nr:hypothetical protein [Candidatus Hydrogenedentota bacterium]
MEYTRVLPILVQFGVGAILCAAGLVAGWRSGYLDLSLADDRREVLIIIGGFAALLLLSCIFTFWLPMVLPEPAV